MDQPEARSQKLMLGLLCVCEGAKYLSHSLMPPRAHVSKKLESVLNGNLNTGILSDMGWGSPKWHFNCFTACLLSACL